MFYQTEVMYRGNVNHISELSDSSAKKIAVICPECCRTVHKYFFKFREHGNFVCQKCMQKEKLGKRQEIGYKKNKLTLIEHTDKYQYSKYKCDCGNEKVLLNHRVRDEHIKSCGCLKIETALYAQAFQNMAGDKHPNWKGGVSVLNTELRTSKEYKNWRKKVFDRDNYTCQICDQKGGTLNAHHIIPFSKNKKLRTDLSNGLTMCKKCHNSFHRKYGKINISQRELELFKRKGNKCHSINIKK